ncbi:MAG: hypothetical protein HW392_616 [Steroidobacteraceae bacterium]|nr:hypothetical protein [Steroidobacteraceae bacterium]
MSANTGPGRVDEGYIGLRTLKEALPARYYLIQRSMRAN